MKIPLITTAFLAASSQAYVIRVWTEPNCRGAAAERNVYDGTCAPTGGFQSFQLLTYGGNTQVLTAYSRNACAGGETRSGCAGGRNRLPLNECINTNGGSNALGSRAQAFRCPGG